MDSDDGAPGHLVVQAARQAAGREGDAAPERGIGRALGAPREFRTARRAAGALSGDDVTQDGVIQRVHCGSLEGLVRKPPASQSRRKELTFDSNGRGRQNELPATRIND
jgi:hypothetical protein